MLNRRELKSKNLFSAPRRLRGESRNKLRFKYGAEVMFLQQFGKFCDSTLFVRSKMVVNVPLEIIATKILVVFLAAADDIIQRVHAEFFRLAQFAAQFLVFNSATQRPDRINEGQIRHFRPRE